MSNKTNMNLLDSDVSAQMLQSIFEACDVEPNTIALEELESYSNYRRDRYAVRKILVTIIMFFFLLIPLLFIAPRISSLEQLDSDNASYRLVIDSMLPVTSVTATIDGSKVALVEEARGVYTIKPEIEGEMITTVKCINRQYDQKKIKVGAPDKEPPELVSSDSSSEQIFLKVKDNSSGIDWKASYSTAQDGTKYPPDAYNEKTGVITFTRYTNPVELVIIDYAGNKLQLVLSLDQ